MYLKHLKDVINLRRTDGEMLHRMMKSDGSAGVSGARANGNDNLWDDADAPLFVSRDKCISVIHGLVTLLLSMDFTCHVDLFIIACKVTGRNLFPFCCSQTGFCTRLCADLFLQMSFPNVDLSNIHFVHLDACLSTVDK